MRTVDPELWYRKIKKPSINVARPLKFGKSENFSVELCIREAFKDAMREFWNNCSMKGVKYIVDQNSSVVSRLQWLLLTLLTLSLGVSAMWSNISAVLSTPPVLFTPQSIQHPIHGVRGVPFAAVALCSNNVISNKLLQEYARHLHANDKTGTYSVGSIERHLQSLGALLNMVYSPTDFQTMQLAHKLTQNISISDAMLKLSPPCKFTLKRCSWRGQLVACERLFATRITSVGFCCVFNSRYQNEGDNIPAKLLDITESRSGLSVVLEEDVGDYVYMRRPGFGTEVLIFDGDEYPLLEGIGVRSYPTWPNSTAYFSITARVQTPDPALQYHNEIRRGCRIPPPSSARSSATWCLTDCRRSTVLALCNCIPYTLLPRPGEVVCGINHLYCLNKHRGKFLYYSPRTKSKEATMSLLEESKDALHCPQCVPDCARVAYSAEVSYSRSVTLQHKLHRNLWFKNQDRTNTTTLHFYYSTADQKLYSVELYHRWYEVIGLLSSQWVFLLGVTLINVSELLYHCSIRWMHHYLRRRRMRWMKSLGSTST